MRKSSATLLAALAMTSTLLSQNVLAENGADRAIDEIRNDMGLSLSSPLIPFLATSAMLTDLASPSNRKAMLEMAANDAALFLGQKQGTKSEILAKIFDEVTKSEQHKDLSEQEIARQLIIEVSQLGE